MGIVIPAEMIDRIHGRAGDANRCLWAVEEKAIFGVLASAAAASRNSGSHGDGCSAHGTLSPIFLTRAKQLPPVDKAILVSRGVHDG